MQFNGLDIYKVHAALNTNLNGIFLGLAACALWWHFRKALVTGICHADERRAQTSFLLLHFLDSSVYFDHIGI